MVKDDNEVFEKF